MEDGDESVLEKLLKINPDYAFVMAMDMLQAGIDTVGKNGSIFSTFFTNFFVDVDSCGRFVVSLSRKSIETREIARGNNENFADC